MLAVSLNQDFADVVFARAPELCGVAVIVELRCVSGSACSG